MMDRFRKLRMLTAPERRWLVQACFLLPMNAAGVRLAGLNRWWRVLAWKTKDRSDVSLAQANQMADMVELATRLAFFNANCLQRSLTLWWLLKRQGVHSELRIGVRLDQQRFEAHAWVEYQGWVLNDSTDVSERFTPFAGAIFPAGTEIR